MTDLKTLAMAANSAHPGIPWHNSDDLIAIGIDDDCDADFVAAASPDVVLAMIERMEKTDEAITWATAQVETIIKERDRLREVLKEATQSLETISMLAGRKIYGNPPIETLLGTFEEVRAYATSRAGVGLQALEAAP